MKSREHAREKREADNRRRKDQWSPKKVPDTPVPDRKLPLPVIRKKREEYPQKSPEEEAKEFLDYLDRYDKPDHKDEECFIQKRSRPSSAAVGRLNLEEGMPVVSEALARLHMGLQEMRCRHVRIVKLIHGYGSSGCGGKICSAVREELVAMKKRKQIRDFIPGENFGPLDSASRGLAERIKSISRDSDYGRMNHGITIVILDLP